MPHILIADDSGFSRDIIQKIVIGAGYTCSIAVDGDKAINSLKTEKFDAAIIDLLMPEKDGYDVIRYVKENNLAIPVLILSADIQLTSQEECLRLGATAFIKKPIKKEIILDTLQQLFN